MRWLGLSGVLAAMFAVTGRSGRAAQDSVPLQPQDPRISLVEQAECLAFGKGRTARQERTGQAPIDHDRRRMADSPPPIAGCAGDPREAARAYLSVCGSLFGLESPGQRLGLRDQTSQLIAENGRVRARHSFVRFQQAHRGVPIVGGELNVQLDERNDILFVGGKALSTIRTQHKAGHRRRRRRKDGARRRSGGARRGPR